MPVPPTASRNGELGPQCHLGEAGRGLGLTCRLFSFTGAHGVEPRTGMVSVLEAKPQIRVSQDRGPVSCSLQLVLAGIGDTARLVEVSPCLCYLHMVLCTCLQISFFVRTPTVRPLLLSPEYSHVHQRQLPWFCLHVR